MTSANGPLLQLAHKKGGNGDALKTLPNLSQVLAQLRNCEVKWKKERKKVFLFLS